MEPTGSKWVGGLLYLDRSPQLGQQKLTIVQLLKGPLGLCACTSKKLAMETSSREDHILSAHSAETAMEETGQGRTF